MSLTDPKTKMSKSSPSSKSHITIISSREQIHNAIRSALTDMSSETITYDPSTRPGVSNLLEILSSFDAEGRHPTQLADEVKDVRELKHLTAEVVVEGLAGVRKRYFEVVTREGGKYVDRVAAEGAERAAESAREVMIRVKEAAGLGGIWEGWKESAETEQV